MPLKCPNPRFPFLYLASWSWTFWHWDISHVIWCELQSVISSQIKPSWPPYCRYCFFYRNSASTCKMFWKKIGKKITFAIRHKKALVLHVMNVDVMNVSGTEIFCLYVKSFQCSILFLLPSLTSWVPEIFTWKCYQRCFLCQQSLSHYLISFQRSPCQVHVPFNNYSTRARWIWDDR